jgi:hypothetical protein
MQALHTIGIDLPLKALMWRTRGEHRRRRLAVEEHVVMQDDASSPPGTRAASLAPRNRVGTWIVLAVLLLLLLAAAAIGYFGWTSTDSDVPLSGYIAMALGAIFSVAVGIGLMALLFYSSRAGYDEPARLIVEPEDEREEAGKSDDGKAP